MRRHIKYIKLQGTDAFLPGIGGLGTTLPPTNKTLSNLSMYVDSDFPNFVTLEISYIGRTVKALVPLTNIQIAEFAADVKPVETVSHPNQSLAV